MPTLFLSLFMFFVFLISVGILKKIKNKGKCRKLPENFREMGELFCSPLVYSFQSWSSYKYQNLKITLTPSDFIFLENFLIQLKLCWVFYKSFAPISI